MKAAKSVNLEYRTKSASVYGQTSKVEEYLKTQGFKLVQKNYSHWTNTGDICYKKGSTQINMKLSLGGSDDIDVDVLINTYDETFEPDNLEKELYKIMKEETK